ncbi:hypothetical protein EVAR_77418_1 [Eumeta japonica]|uniref:Uncharacterized protein n=1 Tax=Eumeta variegata TaxID=151549 RepID=A0A4C1UX98_EUMVA|nr:hypothetical protein EVAR_77418_1 [Eumeta japonica]
MFGGDGRGSSACRPHGPCAGDPRASWAHEAAESCKIHTDAVNTRFRSRHQFVCFNPDRDCVLDSEPGFDLSRSRFWSRSRYQFVSVPQGSLPATLQGEKINQALNTVPLALTRLTFVALSVSYCNVVVGKATPGAVADTGGGRGVRRPALRPALSGSSTHELWSGAARAVAVAISAIEPPRGRVRPRALYRLSDSTVISGVVIDLYYRSMGLPKFRVFRLGAGVLVHSVGIPQARAHGVAIVHPL